MIIHAHIFDPKNALFKSQKSEKSECYWIECNNYENCGLYSRGECSYIKSLDFKRCPYGKYNKEFGFTRRANRFYQWINDRKIKYEEVLDKLSSYKEKIAIVGDYIFLPYTFMDMNESINFISHSGIFRQGNCFVKKEQFTIENIINICEFKPQAMMGGEIKDYQSKSVPKFIKHLSELMPGLCNSLCKQYDRANIILKNYSYIGREAYLSTINQNIGKLKDIHGGLWTWDGKYLISENSHASFMLVREFDEIRVKPKEGATVKITDDNQVNDNTKFLE